MTGNNSPSQARQWSALVATIAAFGILMAIRAEVGSVVIRAGIAGIAAAILVTGIAWSGLRRKRK
jgi:hypothetical protein